MAGFLSALRVRDHRELTASRGKPAFSFHLDFVSGSVNWQKKMLILKAAEPVDFAAAGLDSDAPCSIDAFD
jgi:hypothetical protein